MLALPASRGGVGGSAPWSLDPGHRGSVPAGVVHLDPWRHLFWILWMDSTRSRGFSVEFRMKLTGNADRPGLGIKWDGMIVEDSALGVEGLNNTPGVGL
jgi:hypothetical protein